MKMKLTYIYNLKGNKILCKKENGRKILIRIIRSFFLRPDTWHKMRLVCVLFTFENNAGPTDLRTDGRTDVYDLLWRWDGASKKKISNADGRIGSSKVERVVLKC